LARKALGRVGTVIAQDLAGTETVQAADVVLPVVGTQERAGHYTNWEGRSQRFAASIDAPDLCQQDWEIVVQLAAIQGVDLGFSDLQSLRAERERIGARTDARALPRVAAAPRDEDARADRLALTTYPLLLDRGTMLVGADDLLATARPAYVAVSPADAGALRLSDGRPATVTGGDVAVELPVRIEPGVSRGTVFVPANSTEVPGRMLGSHVTLAAAEEVDA
ncbi:MAG TPA: molybdopterin-dependent oxidoreductase, partial [Nitriliruptorales bacterium]